MGSCFSTQSPPDKVDNNDVLGNKGRKVLDACVKVKIYGKPETRRYDGERALQLFRGCYMHAIGVGYKDFLPAEPNDKAEKTYSIIDIYKAMVKYENMPYVEIYPEGPDAKKMKELIDKRRADVERELEEARINPDGRKMYSWTVAQHRVRNCYAGNFPEDFGITGFFAPGPKSIKNIKDIVDLCDKKAIEVFSDQSKSIDKKALSHRADIQKKYQDALASPGTLYKCSEEEALESLKNCYSVAAHRRFDSYNCQACGNPDFCIYKLYNAVSMYDFSLLPVSKYPAEGPGSEELRNSIERHRTDLEKEYQNFCNSEESRQPVYKYSRGEAERRVRDCFTSAFPGDSDVFPTKNDQSGMPKIYQTFDIFDIKQSLDFFDAKKFLEKYPEKGHISDEIKKRVDEQREHILSEYKIATTNAEIEHGSGFIISDHFILTNRHVIKTCLYQKGFEIRISNAAIGELHCEVVHSDPGKDLALLYCPDLNLHQSGISPLQLSTQSLLPGMQIFSFGYPMSHTEETALFVNGNVSGSKRKLYNHSMAVLNCSLNSGNSGGPVLSWVDGEVRVVGVATQKHFKEILTPDEIEVIENLRKSLQTQTISDVRECDVKYLSDGSLYERIPKSCQVSINLLTLKLYKALETHSQFNLSNALPGDLVVEFIKNFIPEYKGEHKEELIKVCELSQ